MIKATKEILILPNEKTIFLLSGKCGSTSVRRMAIHDLGYENPHDPNLGLKYLQPNEVKQYDDYRKIMVVRNPYTRLISLYKDKVLNGMRPHFRKFQIRPDDTFKQFANKVSKVSDKRADHHFMSQTVFFDYVRPELIIRLEEWQTKWPEDLPVLKKYNSAKPGRVTFDSYYDVETLNLVYNRYKRDFKELGY